MATCQQIQQIQLCIVDIDPYLPLETGIENSLITTPVQPPANPVTAELTQVPAFVEETVKPALVSTDRHVSYADIAAGRTTQDAEVLTFVEGSRVNHPMKQTIEETPQDPPKTTPTEDTKLNQPVNPATKEISTIPSITILPDAVESQAELNTKTISPDAVDGALQSVELDTGAAAEFITPEVAVRSQMRSKKDRTTRMKSFDKTDSTPEETIKKNSEKRLYRQNSGRRTVSNPQQSAVPEKVSGLKTRESKEASERNLSRQSSNAVPDTITETSLPVSEPEVSTTQATETAHVETVSDSSTSNHLSQPTGLSERSKSPMWRAGSGNPSYADILFGRLPQSHRGMGVVVGNFAISEVSKPCATPNCQAPEVQEMDVPSSETTQEIPAPVVEDIVHTPPVENWNPESDKPAYESAEPSAILPMPSAPSLETIQYEPNEYESQYQLIPDTSYAQNYNLQAIQRAYAQLELAIPDAEVTQPSTPSRAPLRYELSIDGYEEEEAESEACTIPTIPEIPIVVEAAEQEMEEPKEYTSSRPVDSKLSYAQILATGLKSPTPPEFRRNSSGSHRSMSPRSQPIVKVEPIAPPTLSVPEDPRSVRGNSEPRQARNSRKLMKNLKSKSFDARDKDLDRMSMRQPSGKAPVSSIKSEKSLDEKEIVVTRPRLRKRRTLETKTFSEEIPVAGVKTDEPEALTADQPVAPPVGSEPEMTKAMMTFYGITTEDIEQFVSSRSQDSDDAEEAAGSEMEKKKKRKKKRKPKPSEIEDEIEKALREINELDRTKKSKLRKSNSIENKAGNPESKPIKLPVEPEIISVKAKREKKMKKSFSMSAGDTIFADPSLAINTTSIPEESGEPSNPTAQRRNRIKKGKAVSFNSEVLIRTAEPSLACQPADTLEVPVVVTLNEDMSEMFEKPTVDLSESISLPAEKEELSDLAPQISIPETNFIADADTDGEFLVLETQQLDTVIPSVHDQEEVERMMEDAMSDDVIVLNTEEAEPVYPGQRSSDSRVLKDILTERADSFEPVISDDVFIVSEELPQVPTPPSTTLPDSFSPVICDDTQIVKLSSPVEATLPSPSSPVEQTVTTEEKCPEEVSLNLITDDVDAPLQSKPVFSTAPLSVSDEVAPHEEDSNKTDSSILVVANQDPLDFASTIVNIAGETEMVTNLDQVDASEVHQSIQFQENVDHSETPSVDLKPLISADVISQAKTSPEPELSSSVVQEPSESDVVLQSSLEPVTCFSSQKEEDIRTCEISQRDHIQVASENKSAESIVESKVITEPITATELPSESPVYPEVLDTSNVSNVNLISPNPELYLLSDNVCRPTTLNYQDADSVVLSPQWMRQRSTLGRTFSLDNRNLPKPSGTLAKSYSTDMPESYSTEEQKEPAEIKSGIKSESQTGGEADDEEVEVYWRLREKKKKKKRRTPLTVPSGASTLNLSESSYELPTSPHTPDSNLTSDDENRKTMTQDEDIQSTLSTPVCQLDDAPNPPESKGADSLPEFEDEDQKQFVTNPTEDIDSHVCANETEEVYEDPQMETIPSSALNDSFYTPLQSVDVALDCEDAPINISVQSELKSGVCESKKPMTCAEKRTSWANLVANSKPKLPEPIVEPEPIAKPSRPFPTLIVVGDSLDEQEATAVDPDSFNEFVGKKERKRRKWRSSQSESHEFSSDAEGTADHPEPEVASESTISEVPEEGLKTEAKDIQPESTDSIAKVETPTVPVSIDSDSDRIETQTIIRQPKPKQVKTAKSVRELEQRKRRSRLSESDQEVFNLAEAIDNNRDLNFIHPKDELLKNIYLDTWPSQTSLDLEKNCWLLNATPSIAETVEGIEVKPITSALVDEEPELTASSAADTIVEKVESAALSNENDVIEDLEVEPIAFPPTAVDEADDSHTSSSHITWANVVAFSKPIVAEPEVELVEEPRPKRPFPNLLVLNEPVDPIPIVSDPSNFTECVGRNERRRRKWRSSQSESQDYTTDEETEEKQPSPDVPAAINEVVETAVSAPNAPDIIIEKVETSAVVEEEQDDEDSTVPSLSHRKDRKTVKPSIPIRETEQRRKRSRLSESEKEALDLANIIEHGEPTPQLYYNLFADSWPNPFYFYLRNAENHWRISEQQSTDNWISSPPAETVQTPVTPMQMSNSNQTSFEQVADESPQISEWKIPVNTQPPPVAQKSIKPLSWAEMVAISKAVEVEKVEASEPVKSRTTKTPVLVVVGEVDDLQSVPVVPSDPSEFTECVGRNERRRRKWRSSYSESCEFSTDGEECSNQPESNAESIPSETKMVTEPEEVQVEPIQSDPVVEPSTNQTCSSEFQPTAKVSFDDDIQTENVKSEEMHSSVKPKKVQTKIEKETKEVERKRQRSRLSESEKEALALAEAIESGCSLPAMSTLSPSDSFWCDQLPHSDAERMWQESLSGQVKVDKNTSKPDQFRRDDRPPPDSGFHGSQPPSLPRNGGEGQFPSSGAERFDSELPSGPPNWSDESTYLAPDTEVTAIHKVG